MQSEIKVHVIDYGRKNLYMRYVDPVTGKQSTRSTGTHKRKDAERIAHKWEAELQEGRYKAPSKVGWAEFRIRYEDEHLSGKAEGTEINACSMFNTVERLIPIERLSPLTAERISYLQSKLRAERLSENTIKSHLRQLKAAFRWANRHGLLNEVPHIEMPTRTGTMKGRPITGEELERMLDSTIDIVGPDAAESWWFLLRGLWWSGLRRTEAMHLHWTDARMICVDFTGRRPMFRIHPDAHKSGKECLLPMAPEFAEMLLTVPEADRTGYVFNPVSKRRHVARVKPPAGYHGSSPGSARKRASK
jgi:integrase